MSRKQIAAVLAALASFAGALTGILGEDGGQPPPRQITVPTRSGPAVAAPATAVQAAANGAEDVHLGPGRETPHTIKTSDAANPQGDVVRGPVPLASAHQAGCLSRFNRNNYSPRSGTRPSLMLLHLPVAYNHPGWGDVNGVHIFLDRASTAASVNYQNDDEGHCVYSVPETYKAWGQSNYNGATACSVEQQGYGTEPVFIHLGGPGLRQLARIYHDCAHRWGIKLQLAKVDGHGGVIREGLIDHLHLGPAGGGHVDILGFGPRCVQQGRSADTLACVQAVLDAARALDRKPITAAQRKRCGELNRLRGAARKRGWHSPALERANAIKAGERKNGLRCLFPPRRHRLELVRG